MAFMYIRIFESICFYAADRSISIYHKLLKLRDHYFLSYFLRERSETVLRIRERSGEVISIDKDLIC